MQAKGIDAARLESEMLMCHCLDCERHQLYMSFIDELEPDTVEEYFYLLKRRLDGEPIQYILGSREFMGLSLDVDKNVLIPRWETELLVEHIIKEAGNKYVNVLDIGTGSGAIAISLAHFLPKSNIVAVDNSEGALATAKNNALKHMVSDRIDFFVSDMFTALEGSLYKHFFDIIVSNPPYIKSKEIDSLMREVKDYEPISALDGGPDGLTFYRHIANSAYMFLKPEGFVAVEMGYNQALEIEDIFLKTGRYCNAHILKDLSGIDRIAVFYKPNEE